MWNWRSASDTCDSDDYGSSEVTLFAKSIKYAIMRKSVRIYVINCYRWDEKWKFENFEVLVAFMTIIYHKQMEIGANWNELMCTQAYYPLT